MCFNCGMVLIQSIAIWNENVKFPTKGIINGLIEQMMSAKCVFFFFDLNFDL